MPHTLKKLPCFINPAFLNYVISLRAPNRLLRITAHIFTHAQQFYHERTLKFKKHFCFTRHTLKISLKRFLTCKERSKQNGSGGNKKCLNKCHCWLASGSAMKSRPLIPSPKFSVNPAIESKTCKIASCTFKRSNIYVTLLQLKHMKMLNVQLAINENKSTRKAYLVSVLFRVPANVSNQRFSKCRKVHTILHFYLKRNR